MDLEGTEINLPRTTLSPAQFYGGMGRTNEYLGKNLQTMMKERGLSVATLARIIGMNKSTLHNYYNGVIPRNIESLKKLSEYFGIPIDKLLFEEPPVEEPPDASDKSQKSIEGRYEVIIRLMDKNIRR